MPGKLFVLSNPGAGLCIAYGLYAALYPETYRNADSTPQLRAAVESWFNTELKPVCLDRGVSRDHVDYESGRMSD